MMTRAASWASAKPATRTSITIVSRVIATPPPVTPYAEPRPPPKRHSLRRDAERLFGSSGTRSAGSSKNGKTGNGTGDAL
jgi:hypothetical protein